MRFRFKYNDGGRAQYHSNDRRQSDCVLRALSIYFNEDYEVMYQKMRDIIGRKKYKYYRGVNDDDLEKLMKELGFEFHPINPPRNLNTISFSCKKFIVDSKKHLSTIINGVIYDTYDIQEDAETNIISGYYTHNNY